MLQARARQMQAAAAMGLGGAALGGAVGFGAGSLMGGPAVGLGVGSLMAAQGAAPGYRVLENAVEPNIRDVWADKLRMMMQGN